MVDAVNAPLQTTASVTAIAANVPDARTTPDRGGDANVRPVAPQAEKETSKLAQAPFISPAIFVDVNFDKAVIQIRDPDTGDVEETIPSESDLERQARLEEFRQRSGTAAEQSYTKPVQFENVDTASREAARAQSTVSSATATTVSEVQSTKVQASAEQIAAFESAARSGDSNAGTISLFA